MTKYIDLLRAHQKHQPEAVETEEGELIEVAVKIQPETSTPSSHNPYSTPTHGEALTFEHTGELLDEAIPLDIQQPIQDNISNEDLIAKDEEVKVAPKPIAKTTVAEHKKPAKTTAVHDKSDSFDVHSWLNDISCHVLTIFQAAQKQQSSDISSLNEMLRSFIDHINAENHTLSALELQMSREIKNIRDIDASAGDLVQKSMMMMLYALKTGQQLKLQQQELMHITIAAMLHHIGMVMIDDEIRHKKERLTRSELKLIKQAPASAHAYLTSCHIEEESILLAAAQAAERYDGSGATGLTGHEIAWSARLIGLLSMFEALTHFRPYRQRFLPRDAIRELVNHHKKAFDPDMLKALIESISLYPVGTFVQINTGEIGQVIMVHNKFPLRPNILISMDKYGNKAAEREINLKLQPNLMIQKCMYEESLADLKSGKSHS
ncbi:MAG: HD domain-containing phosphohydrolase [Mariprofundaceae bacterium]|nr:HD domain-containing phosphohydrolase [Mariprofundaceae bacterium]